jgi:hypothetical protein
MTGTSSRKYVIKLHQTDDGSVGGYGVHRHDGQIISGYPTLERAERAMARFIARDKRLAAHEIAVARAKSAFVS